MSARGKLVPYERSKKRDKDKDIMPPIPLHHPKPWQVHFVVWCDRYEYFVTSILNNLHTAMVHQGSAVVYDWFEVRDGLERYLYETSFNRNRSYYLLSGPR